MNIAFLSYYSGNVFRGVETYVHELATNLVNAGHSVVVYQSGPAIKGSIYETRVISSQKIVSSSLNKTNIPFLNLKALHIKAFSKAVLNKLPSSVDVVIATNGQWQSFLSRLWCLKHKNKLIIPGQSGIGLDDRINLYCFPHYFIGISSAATKWASRVNPFIKSVYIPNGVNLEKFTASGKVVKQKEPVIVCVGALVPEKRLDLTIQAVALIPNVKLLIVGAGPLKERLHLLGKKLMKNRIQFMEVTYMEMPKVYRNAQLFTLTPAISESFGIVYLEALASGLPVVCINDAIRKEIVGEAGLFISDPENKHEYAAAIKKALAMEWNNKPRLQSEKFDWKAIAKQYEQLFIK